MAELQITCGEAYDFTKTLPPKTSHTEIARQLITSKLTIKGSLYRSEEDEDYKRFVNIVKCRIAKLLPKIRNHAFERNQIKRTDILIDLSVDCPELVPTDSQPMSQGSVGSESTITDSQSRVLQFLEVDPPTQHRKLFHDLGPE